MDKNISLHYPVGPCIYPDPVRPSDRADAIHVLEIFPRQLADAVSGLSSTQLDTPYRPGGWTVRQLVHHVADSHLNAYSRMRHALTSESAAEWPFIYPYDEKAWADLPEVTSIDPAISLELLRGVHGRWVAMLKTIPHQEWSTRGYTHPANGRQSLQQALLLYAWHSRHHLAHVVNCQQNHGW